MDSTSSFFWKYIFIYWWFFWIFWRLCVLWKLLKKLWTVQDWWLYRQNMSYVILFRNEKVYKLFEDIFFTNYNKTSFDDRGFNGLVLTLHLNGQKVLLHLHSSTYTLHIQGKACRQCFFGFFSVLAKQLHDEINLDKNPQNSEKLTRVKHVKILFRYLKLILHQRLISKNLYVT